MTNPSDLPGRLLAFAVRRMRCARTDWATAMLAELAQVEEPRARWEFALGCAWAAIFPPECEGTRRMRILPTAALVGTVLVVPLIYLETRRGYPSFPYPLFTVLWLVPIAAVLLAAPLIGAIRGADGVLARPAVTVARLGLLALAVLFWLTLVHDQMPCFLGVPNCD